MAILWKYVQAKIYSQRWIWSVFYDLFSSQMSYSMEHTHTQTPPIDGSKNWCKQRDSQWKIKTHSCVFCILTDIPDRRHLHFHKHLVSSSSGRCGVPWMKDGVHTWPKIEKSQMKPLRCDCVRACVCENLLRLIRVIAGWWAFLCVWLCTWCIAHHLQW